MRLLRHLFARSSRSVYPEDSLRRIADAVHAAEQRHTGEICFAVESALHWRDVLKGVDSRQRAEAAFARLRVWDTEANNGVLLYLLLADHAIEIVADRGLEGRVSGEEWEQVCRAVEAAIAGGDALEPAVIAGIGRISALLATHWPATGAGRDELPDRPVLL